MPLPISNQPYSIDFHPTDLLGFKTTPHSVDVSIGNFKQVNAGSVDEFIQNLFWARAITPRISLPELVTFSLTSNFEVRYILPKVLVTLN